MLDVLEELWKKAMVAHGVIYGPGPSALRLAREGHPNALVIVKNALGEHALCSCGGDDLCEGVDPKGDREALRAALAELLPALRDEG